MSYTLFFKELNHKGTLAPLPTGHVSDPTNNKYRFYTLYEYDENSMKDHLAKNDGSHAGYPHTVFSRKLIFDLDCKDDLQLALEDVRKLIQYLVEHKIDVSKCMNVYFSGNKGFHVIVNLNDKLSNEETHMVCASIAEAARLTTFDHSIYDKIRKFRLVNSEHDKSGLYKIPLSDDDVYGDANRIRAKAVKPIPGAIFASQPINNDLFVQTHKKPLKSKSVVVEIDTDINGVEDIDFDKCPKDMPRCLYAMSKGIMVSGIGERSAIFLRLCAYWRNRGYDKEMVRSMLGNVSINNVNLYPDSDAFTAHDIDLCIQNIYSNNWEQVTGASGIGENNPIFRKYCTELSNYTDHDCPLHKNKAQVVKVGAMARSFGKFASDLKHNIILTGIDFIDRHMKIQVGTTTLICGATGCGKTSLMLNIIENANFQGINVLFFSLDMHKNLVYLKLAQKLTKYSQNEILKAYENNDKKIQDDVNTAIEKAYPNTFFDFHTTRTIEGMTEIVKQTEEDNNCDIKMVVVDYASRVSGKYSDAYANARHNALASTTAAQETNAAWFWINQVSRAVGDGSTPLRSKRVAKESGDWEESASQQINVWRPWIGDSELDNIMKVFLAKNRMGKEIESPLFWNGARCEIRDLSEGELDHYDENRKDEEPGTKKSGFGAK